MCQVYFVKEKINLFFGEAFEYIQWFLCYKFINAYFIKFSNEKISLNTILTNQFQIYLFSTFIISKFTINPVKGSIVSKWNLSKIWIYFLVFSWKTTFFLYWYFFDNFLKYILPCFHLMAQKKNLLNFKKKIQKWFLKI